MISPRPGSHRKISVTCELQVATDCKKTWVIQERLASETRRNNKGAIICSRCSIKTKRSGRTNPNAKYQVDDNLFSKADTQAKAYFLGWVASDGTISNSSLTICLHRKDQSGLQALRDLICSDIPLKAKKGVPQLSLTISSQQIVRDICSLLGLKPGKKSHIVRFPQLESEELKWAFLRGYFEGDGSIGSINAAYRKSTWPRPVCNITSSSSLMLEEIQALVGSGDINGDKIEWGGVPALDMLGRLYADDNIPRLARKFDLYLDWCTWVPAKGHKKSMPEFTWVKVLPNAQAPFKSMPSDSGYDLTLLEPLKKSGNVIFYRTGVKIQPAFGWYFDLVPRSSIVKSGHLLANSVGVIDRGYVGEILVPLIKIDPDSPNLKLPARIVQIVPRQIISARFHEVQSFDDTQRGTGGFGSTGR